MKNTPREADIVFDLVDQHMNVLKDGLLDVISYMFSNAQKPD